LPALAQGVAEIVHAFRRCSQNAQDAKNRFGGRPIQPSKGVVENGLNIKKARDIVQ
jgi:hypothetical protein